MASDVISLNFMTSANNRGLCLHEIKASEAICTIQPSDSMSTYVDMIFTQMTSLLAQNMQIASPALLYTIGHLVAVLAPHLHDMNIFMN